MFHTCSLAHARSEPLAKPQAYPRDSNFEVVKASFVQLPLHNQGLKERPRQCAVSPNLAPPSLVPTPCPPLPPTLPGSSSFCCAPQKTAEVLSNPHYLLLLRMLERTRDCKCDPRYACHLKLHLAYYPRSVEAETSQRLLPEARSTISSRQTIANSHQDDNINSIKDKERKSDSRSEWSQQDVEQMQRDLRRNLEEDIHVRSNKSKANLRCGGNEGLP